MGGVVPLVCLTGYAFQVCTVIRRKRRTEALQQILIKAQSIRAADTLFLSRVVMLVFVTVTTDTSLARCGPI